MRNFWLAFVPVLLISGSPTFGDDVLFRYEGDVFPWDPSAGWLIYDPCVSPCVADVARGAFVLRWAVTGDITYFTYRIAVAPAPPPPTLWAEWRFRSNHPLSRNADDCDGYFDVVYQSVSDLVFMYGDAAISFAGDESVHGLDLNDYHTYRFESPDGQHYRFSVDGVVFRQSFHQEPNDGYTRLQFGGIGGCLDDWIPNLVNEWDCVRFSTIAYGEQVVSSKPPQGFIDTRLNLALDRFTVTYDAPNYVYIDQVSASTFDGSPAPHVIATRRLDNGEPDTVEIILDRPISFNTTTKFTFDDGVATNVVEFTYAPGDTNGDGQADLTDFATFQNCFSQLPPTGACMILDSDADKMIDNFDYASFLSHMDSP